MVVSLHEFQKSLPHAAHCVTDLLWPCFIRISLNGRTQTFGLS